MHDLERRSRRGTGRLRAALPLLLVAGPAPRAAPRHRAPARARRRPPTPDGDADGRAERRRRPRATTPTALYEAIEAQVVAHPRPPAEAPRSSRKVIDEAELRATLTEQFDKDTPAGVRGRQRAAVQGARPDARRTATCAQLTLDLLSAGVAGFYRNDEDKLYVVSRSGRLGGNEKITYAHEYDHALQDQTWPVFTDQEDVLDQSDWIIARQAAYEGDATLLMTQWAIAAT